MKDLDILTNTYTPSRIAHHDKGFMKIPKAFDEAIKHGFGRADTTFKRWNCSSS